MNQPTFVDLDPKWTKPDPRKAGYCLTCDKGVWLADIQKLHPDATKRNLAAKGYNVCPKCNEHLIPF